MIDEQVPLLTAEDASTLLLQIIPEVVNEPERFRPASPIGTKLCSITTGRAIVVPAITRERLREALGEPVFFGGGYDENQILAALRKMGMPTGD